MKKTTTKQVKLTTEEVAKLLKEQLELPPNAEVYFNVRGFQDPGDWSSSQPLDYRLADVTISYTQED